VTHVGHCGYFNHNVAMYSVSRFVYRHQHKLAGVSMKKLLLAVVVTSLALSASAFAAKDCEELKSEIDAKIKANGIATYTLEIVAKDAEADGKVVGTCAGGEKKIVYKKG
jgi:predicted lipoprotein with Yx(FWY)xxD motif